MHNRKKLIIFTIIIVIVVLFVFMMCSSQRIDLIFYDESMKSVYIYGEGNPLLENFVAPVWLDNIVIAVFIDGNEPFIGKYMMEECEYEVLLPISQFQEELDEQIEISQFSNLRITHNGNLTFIYDDVLYCHNPSTKEMDVLLVLNNVQKYEWMDENTLLILDEVGDLEIGWLKKYDFQSQEELIISKSVTDFVYLSENNQVVYAKKYFMGSWCEYELVCTDADTLTMLRKRKYLNTSIGQLVVDSDDNIFIVESRLSLDNDLQVKRILKGTMIVISVMEVERNKYCIGVK